DVTASPSRTSAHSSLRAKSTTGPDFPFFARVAGCSMFAEAKTSAASPRSSRSRNSPDAPNSSRTDIEYWAVKRSEPVRKAVRRLPPEYTRTASWPNAAYGKSVAARTSRGHASLRLVASHHDVRRLDDRIGLVSRRQLQFFDGFIGDRCGDDGAAE